MSLPRDFRAPLCTGENSGTNKRKLVTGLTYLQEVDLINLNSALFRQISFDRLNTDFEPLFNLAKLFFHNSQPGLSQGKDKTFSFLVPVHLLFENFVAKVINSFTSEDFEYCYHHPQLHLGKHNGEDVFLLEPDFTIIHNNKVVTILDTKFKYPFNKDGDVEISTDDLYQLTAYSVRYNCKKLFLIYPKYLGIKNNAFLLTEYQIKSTFGEISHRVVQIDIMNQDLSAIIDELKINIRPDEELIINSSGEIATFD